jgi:hypothetical protein
MSQAVTRTRAKAVTSSELEVRVAEIRMRMRAGLWKRGETALELAEVWGVTQATVEGYSAEAWRRVCAEADDASAARPTIAGTLAIAFEQAAVAKEFRAVASLADTWSKVVGARAPERHEHAHVVAQFEALPREGKVAWLRERAAKLITEADRLEVEG